MKRYKSSNSYLIGIIFLLLLIIGMGYAYLTSNLSISGNTEVTGNTWNIHFANIVEKEGSVVAINPATINATDNTKVSFSIKLSKPGDFYEFNVDAVNDGSIDGMIGTLNNVELTENQQKYLTYTLTYEDGVPISANDQLLSGTSETINCRVEFKKDIENSDLPTTTSNLSLSFSFAFIQSNSNAKERYRIPTIGTNKNDINLGDYFDIGTNIYESNRIIGTNETILSDWRVFNKDSEGISIILADYMPNSSFDLSSLDVIQINDYIVKNNTNRVSLLNGLTDPYWINFINNSNLSAVEEISIKASPSIEEFVNSWNSNNNYVEISIKKTDVAMPDGLFGYYIKLPDNSFNYAINVSSDSGYNNTLYFPHKTYFSEVYGYWLISPSAESIGEIYSLRYDGQIIGYDDYLDSLNSIRPIIYLPNNIKVSKNNDIWIIE